MVSVRVMTYRHWEFSFPSLCVAFSCCFSKTCLANPFTGSVSTVTLPLIITTIITSVNQASTLYASCSSSSNLMVTTPISAISQSTTTAPQSSSTPATSTRTIVQSQTFNFAPIVGGALGGFFFLIGVVAITWFIRCILCACPWTKSHPYIFIFARKKCCKSNAVIDETDIVIPYPMTRGRNQSNQLGLSNESRPYESGFLGRSTHMTGAGSSSL